MYSVKATPLEYSTGYYYELLKEGKSICDFQSKNDADFICELLNLYLKKIEVLKKKDDVNEEFIECLEKWLMEASRKGFIPSDAL